MSSSPHSALRRPQRLLAAALLGTAQLSYSAPAVGTLEEVATLPIRLPIDLPSIGIITLRARGPTPTTARLIDCLRQVAGARRARSGDGGRSSFPARG